MARFRNRILSDGSEWSSFVGFLGGSVNVAELLVTEPAELLTTTAKVAPLSAVVVAGAV
jgi:hypothetical protein